MVWERGIDDPFRRIAITASKRDTCGHGLDETRVDASSSECGQQHRSVELPAVDQLSDAVDEWCICVCGQVTGSRCVSRQRFVGSFPHGCVPFERRFVWFADAIAMKHAHTTSVRP